MEALKQAVLGLLLFVAAPVQTAQPYTEHNVFCESQAEVESLFDLRFHKNTGFYAALEKVNDVKQVCAVMNMRVLEKEVLNKLDANGEVWAVYKYFGMVPIGNGISIASYEYGMAPAKEEIAM